jgi:hypothetical protein
VSRDGEDGPRVPGEPNGEEEVPGELGADDGDGADGSSESLSPVTITVDDEHRAALGQVVEGLRQRGMQVDAVLEGLGMVTGRARDAAALWQVEGVSGVDSQIVHRLPPPDAEIQ